MKLTRRISIFVALVVGALSLSTLNGCTKCSKSKDDSGGQSGQTPADAVQGDPVQDTPGAPGSIEIVDISTGSGADAVDGARITVHYTGTLENGTKFDSSIDRNSPFSFTLGQGQVIAGWDQGVKGMKVGGKRKLVIPPQLAYGERGVGGVIPPNATLVFEIELLNVE